MDTGMNDGFQVGPRLLMSRIGAKHKVCYGPPIDCTVLVKHSVAKPISYLPLHCGLGEHAVTGGVSIQNHNLPFFCRVIRDRSFLLSHFDLS